MAQASPTNILLAQAAHRLELLQRSFGIQKFKAPEDVSKIISQALTDLETNAGKSLTPYNPIFKSEVPSSSKMNAFWTNLEADVNVLQQQLDLLRAATISTHNFLKTEIQKASRENARSQNKLKTLELYSNVDDSSLVYFGDTFITEDFVDWNFVPTQAGRLQFFGNQSIGLGLDTQESALEDSPLVSILEGSNGMLGNNEEITDPSASTTTSVGSYTRYYFKSEVYTANELESLVDSEPTSWIEFEKYYIPPQDRAAASDYNFNYKFVNKPEWSYLAPFVKSNSTINWADGLGSDGVSGTLVLNIQIDIRSPQRVNLITLLPFGLEDNINNPIKIKRVSTSLDNTTWHTLNPQDTWLANSIDRKIVDINSENIVIGQGAWVTNGSPIRFIRFEIEQPASIPSNIGHLYYYLDDESAGAATAARQLGPIPTLDDTGRYIDASNSDLGDLVQRMEYYAGRRWAIGIRDIAAYNNTYQPTGTIVSQKFEVPGVIDRVALDAEVEIPNNYDPDTTWIKFYVSPNNGVDWFQISRIQDDFSGVPEIIAFNDPTPVELREAGVAYYEVPGVVSSIRLKVEMERSADDEHSTPLLKPYTLKIKRRS